MHSSKQYCDQVSTSVLCCNACFMLGMLRLLGSLQVAVTHLTLLKKTVGREAAGSLFRQSAQQDEAAVVAKLAALTKLKASKVSTAWHVLKQSTCICWQENKCMWVFFWGGGGGLF